MDCSARGARRMVTLSLFVATFVLWWGVRASVAQQVERKFAKTHPLDGSGYIKGAAPFALEGTRPGAVLLLHGFNDSPQAMRTMAAALHGRGWTVRVPALPGHARTLPDFAASRAEQWIQAAREELAALRASHAQVAIGGLSLGGAICFVLAAEDPGVRAVIGFAPYLHASIPLRLVGAVAPIAAIGARYMTGGGERSVHDPVAREAMIAYGRSTPRLAVEVSKVVAIAREALPRVMQPVLVVQSRDDNRIPSASAAESFALVGSEDKVLHWTDGNGHVVTVDYGHEAVEQFAADWLESRLS